MSLPKIEDTMQTPPGGWRYEQPETGTVLTASGYVELCGKIKIHRAANGLSQNDPEMDVRGYICAKYPDLCKIPPTYEEKTSFGVGDVRAFLNTVVEAVKRRGEDAFVSMAEADRRAAICVTCPLNKTIPGCYGCASLAPLIVEAVSGRSSKWQGKLRQCGICGCALAAKVHLTRGLIFETQAKEYAFPSWCWLA